MRYESRRALVASSEIDGKPIYSSPVVIRTEKGASRDRIAHFKTEAHAIATQQIRDTYRKHIIDNPDALLAAIAFHGFVEVLVPVK